MTKNKKIRKLKKEKKLLAENLQISAEQLELAADDLMKGATIIAYQSGQIAAYRYCLGLND